MDWPGLWGAGKVITWYSVWPESSSQKGHSALSYLWGVGGMQGEDYRISEPVWQFSCLTTSLSWWYLYSVIKLWLESYKEVNSLTPLLRSAWSSMESPCSWSCIEVAFYATSMILKLSPMNPSFVASHEFYLPGRQSYEDTISYCPNHPTPFTVIGGKGNKETNLNIPPSSHCRVACPLPSCSLLWITLLL